MTLSICGDREESQLVIRLDDWRLEDPAFRHCKTLPKYHLSPISHAWSESFNKEEGAFLEFSQVSHQPVNSGKEFRSEYTGSLRIVISEWTLNSHRA